MAAALWVRGGGRAECEWGVEQVNFREIFYMPEFLTFFGLTAAGLIFLIWQMRKSKGKAGLLSKQNIDFRPLKLRLGKYSEMLGQQAVPASSLLSSQNSSYSLSSGEHKILLGVLKKIEAKNAVLSAINIFMLTAGTKIYYDMHGSMNSLQRPLFLSMIFFLFILILARVEGNGHLGQRHFNGLRCEPPLEGSLGLGEKMQEALMLDLLKKEALFDFSYRAIAIVFFLSLAIFFLGFFKGF